MIAMRNIVTLVRVIGVLALALIVFALAYPEHLGKWIGNTAVEPGLATAPKVQVAAGVAAAPAGGAAVPAAVPVGFPAVAAKPDPSPVAAEPVKATKSQAAMAQWLGTKYRVSPGAIAALIVDADKLSKAYALSPNLIISVMAIESNFHPYIQSEAGAQGLMQVMPVIHAKRYEKYGGKSSFIDPIVSLKVGAEILRDCVKLRGGSEAKALRFYFGGGAASAVYIEKVQTEQRRLNQVAAGVSVPVD